MAGKYWDDPSCVELSFNEKIPLGVLHPAPESSAEEMWTCSSPEETVEMLQGLELLCCVQPGEEEVPGRPQSLFQGLNKVFRKEEK